MQCKHVIGQAKETKEDEAEPAKEIVAFGDVAQIWSYANQVCITRMDYSRMLTGIEQLGVAIVSSSFVYGAFDPVMQLPRGPPKVRNYLD